MLKNVFKIVAVAKSNIIGFSYILKHILKQFVKLK